MTQIYALNTISFQKFNKGQYGIGEVTRKDLRQFIGSPLAYRLFSGRKFDPISEVRMTKFAQGYIYPAA